MDTVWFENDAVAIIDQTLLPNEQKTLVLETLEEVWEAINVLRVRGAPAIGVAAAYAIYMAALKSKTVLRDELITELEKAGEYLKSSRPTAVNLPWAIDRMLSAAREANNVREALKKEANNLRVEDIEVCRAIGMHGLSLIKPGDGVLTHCNAGSLATVRYGTATAPLYLANELGYGLRIYVDETRPLLQGARLTAYELKAAGMDVTLQCDGMAASLMKEGLINAVFVGCDRMAANGDGANKIGTLPLAIAAKHFGVPFYMFVPVSSFDLTAESGNDIVIEQRSGLEITEKWYSKRMAPEGIKIYNPAFDITDSGLITGIVTERGILKPPFEVSIREALT